MAELRTKWVHVKLTEQERAQWQAQAQAAGLTLADHIRQLLGEARPVGRDPIRRRASRRADPELLAALGRIGSNLNQIAKWANTYKSQADAVQVLAALISIEDILSSYRPGVSGAKPLTDEVDGLSDVG